MNLADVVVLLGVQLLFAFVAERLWDRWVNRPTEWVVRFDRAARDRVRTADLERMRGVR